MHRIVYPKIANIEVTTVCPYSCPQCYKIKNSSIFNMSIDTFKDISEQLIKLGCQRILISGGEALIYSDIIEAVRFLKEHDVEMMVSTGGVSNKGILLKLKEAGLTSLYVSLNGSNKLINSLSRDGYDNAVQTIKYVNEIGIQCKINWVARNDNVDDFKSLLLYAEENKVYEIDVLRYKPASEKYEDISLKREKLLELAEIIKEYNGKTRICVENCFFELKSLLNIGKKSKLLKGCSAGKFSVSFFANGLVSPCAHGGDMYSELLSDYDNFEKYWNTSAIVKLFRSGNHQELCEGCKYCEACEPCRLVFDKQKACFIRGL